MTSHCERMTWSNNFDLIRSATLSLEDIRCLAKKYSKNVRCVNLNTLGPISHITQARPVIKATSDLATFMAFGLSKYHFSKKPCNVVVSHSRETPSSVSADPKISLAKCAN